VIEDLHNIGEDYDPTLMAWWDNFDPTHPENAPRSDRKYHLMCKYYLLAAAGAPRARDGQLYQMVLTRTGRAKPDHVRAS
jgi:cyclopropane-fatty-acyl-phospholipid synthase